MKLLHISNLVISQVWHPVIHRGDGGALLSSLPAFSDTEHKTDTVHVVVKTLGILFRDTGVLSYLKYGDQIHSITFTSTINFTHTSFCDEAGDCDPNDYQINEIVAWSEVEDDSVLKEIEKHSQFQDALNK
jgi:hypothetical protein